MKLHNSTNYPDYFLRRMVSWCCKEIGLPVRHIREAKFRKGGPCHSRGTSASGRAWRRRFVVTHGYADGDDLEKLVMNDLVRTDAHELVHVFLFREGSNTRRSGNGGGSERETNVYMRRVYSAFEIKRDELLAAWNQPPKQRPATPKPTVQEKRAKAVSEALARWQRKLKLAQTKVKQYRSKARYYEKALAAKGK